MSATKSAGRVLHWRERLDDTGSNMSMRFENAVSVTMGPCEPLSGETTVKPEEWRRARLQRRPLWMLWQEVGDPLRVGVSAALLLPLHAAWER